MDKRIHLKWNDYSSTVISSLQRFQNKEWLCDSTIVCNENFYPVHRLLLSLCSEHFEKIYEKVSCRHPIIVITGIESVHLKAILDFVYHGEAELSNDALAHFLKAAETLKIKGLTCNKNTSRSNIKNLKKTEVDERAKYGSSDTKGRNRSPIILDPIVSIEKLENFINLNDANSYWLSGDKINKKVETSVKKRKYRGESHLLTKNNVGTDVSEGCKVSQKQFSKTVEGNNNSSSNYLVGNLKHYCKNDTLPKFMECNDTGDVTKTSSNFCSNLISNIETSQIIIDSYYGGCSEEFDTTTNADGVQNVDSVAIKVELPEFFSDENSYLESSSILPVKTEPLSNEEYSKIADNNLTDASLFDTNVKVVGNYKMFEGASEGTNSLKNSSCHESLDERKMFSSVVLKEPVPEVGCQKQTENFSLRKVNGHKCKQCPYVSTKKLLSIHESAHESIFSYKCKFCWYRSVSKGNTLKHQKYYHKNRFGMSKKVVVDANIVHKKEENAIKVSSKSKLAKYKCHYCSYSSRHAGHLKLHQRTHSAKTLRCKLCSFTSFFKSSLTKHKFKAHVKGISNENNIRMFKCQECLFSSRHKHVVDKHKNCHTGNNFFKCKTCSYSAKLKGVILRHELLHHAGVRNNHLNNSVLTDTVSNSLSEKKYKCGKCKFSTMYKQVLSRHELIHTKNILVESQGSLSEASRVSHINTLMITNKKYKCRFCPYSNMLNDRISKHETHHKMKKRHNCPSCSFSSDNIGRVNSHKWLHNMNTTEKSGIAISRVPSKTIICQHCSYVSANVTLHRRHSMMHTNEKPYACDNKKCNYRSNYKADVLKHQIRCPAL